MKKAIVALMAIVMMTSCRYGLRTNEMVRTDEAVSQRRLMELQLEQLTRIADALEKKSASREDKVITATGHLLQRIVPIDTTMETTEWFKYK